VKGNDRTMDEVQVKKYMIRGVDRASKEIYQSRM